ncbi:L-serine ammonia-lyase [Methylobacterium isbiliense]|jgi:L-serine dehydratase|uniref:L-serine dehydratase n=1 Tax=Methylobacterium isbiliense TaxID=315478 RepID=A0ABQ4SB61_9HYPH|nr:L-serine ammonia-lyase [Methylobacterium isbiliense]MDN3627168.1 L-serine ammonia-lyase [Methylobacterium isbiliense]GJD99027.1 L-serine dehydratase TdcG [Methylobacterium isbiliense]
MFLSVFDVFKPGIGPSSSHTMGPMTAAADFLDLLRGTEAGRHVAAIRVTLHGSLAFTGRGHATDRAVALGLLGFRPAEIEMDEAERRLADLARHKTLKPDTLPEIAFDPACAVVFDFGPPLPGHANGLILTASGAAGDPILCETYYSIGGGFVVTAAQLEAGTSPPSAAADPRLWPYPFDTAAAMLRMAQQSGLSIAAMKRANEAVSRSAAEVDAGLARIWQTMNGCVERGLSQDGELPGGLHVKRRAKRIREQLVRERGSNTAQPHAIADWLSVYAMAVNEENAAGGKVVTAPTNGAAGVVPAVARYYLDHCIGADVGRIPEFLLTAAAIGGLIKHNASISGAEAGCQGEVGSASAMAAAGLCAVLGGTPAQVENAAEIALEHHLGMTCDPVAGLVQVPCIERNGIGATKAVAAASLALRGDGTHFMPLDNCIAAMRQTGEEMNAKYKETSLGGLAVNLPEC